MPKSILIVLLFFGVSHVVFAQKLPQFLHDEADVFTPEEEKKLTKSLRKYRRKTTTEIAVFSIKTLGDESLETYAFNLANRLELGKADKDNGILILIAKKERKIRIELGIGANRYISNEQARIMIDDKMTPLFRESNFYEGVNAALQEMYRLLGDKFND